MKNLFVCFLFIGLVFVGSSNFYVSSASTNKSLEAKCAIQKFDDEYANSKAVFIGEVISVEIDGDKKIYEFKVKKYWKGIEDTKVKVAVYENMRFQSPYNAEKTFLVFAKEDENGELFDQRCSRSKDLNGTSADLKDDLKKLGEGKTCISLEDKEEKKKG